MIAPLKVFSVGLFGLFGMFGMVEFNVVCDIIISLYKVK